MSPTLEAEGACYGDGDADADDSHDVDDLKRFSRLLFFWLCFSLCWCLVEVSYYTAHSIPGRQLLVLLLVLGVLTSSHGNYTHYATETWWVRDV